MLGPWPSHPWYLAFALANQEFGLQNQASYCHPEICVSAELENLLGCARFVRLVKETIRVGFSKALSPALLSPLEISGKMPF